MVDIYRYTDVFFLTLIIMRSLKEHTTQNVPRIKTTDKNVSKFFFLQILSLKDFVIRKIYVQICDLKNLRPSGNYLSLSEMEFLIFGKRIKTPA